MATLKRETPASFDLDPGWSSKFKWAIYIREDLFDRYLTKAAAIADAEHFGLKIDWLQIN